MKTMQEKKAKIRKRLSRAGGNWVFIVPKVLIDAEVLDPAKEYVVRIEESLPEIEENAQVALCSRYQDPRIFSASNIFKFAFPQSPTACL